MNDSTAFELIPEYALGALSEPERSQVEALLARSEEARTELRVYESMLTGVAALTPMYKAPARLGNDFRAWLAASNQGAQPVVESPALRPAVAARRARSVWWLIGLAAILIAIIGLLAVPQIQNRLREDQRARDIAAIRQNPDCAWFTLNALNQAGGMVRIGAVPGENRAILVVDSLAALPGDKQYQLWLVKGTNRISGGVFSASATNPKNTLLIELPSEARDWEAAGITVEPAGGSSGPTGSAVFQGKFDWKQ